MHLIVAFAGVSFADAQGGAPAAPRPNLAALLARLAAEPATPGESDTLTPPHERAYAEAIGMSGADGTLPFAALAAIGDGLDPARDAIGLVTPSHWRVGRDAALLDDPDDLALDADTSRVLFDAVQPLFDAEGVVLRWGAPLRWYALHDELDALPCASLDRAIGRPIDRRFAPDARARRIRRLQSEVQMRLYEHPVNAAREAADLVPVNSVWLSGCGRAQVVRHGPVALDTTLRRAALHGDAAAWQAAWQALDAGPIGNLAARAARGEPVVLTLCGERSAQRFVSSTRGWWQRLAGPRRVDPQPVLEAL